MNNYQAMGYSNRRDYLQHLASDFGLDFETVATFASMLGPNEDFDGLMTTLEDYAEEMEDYDED